MNLEIMKMKTNDVKTCVAALGSGVAVLLVIGAITALLIVSEILPQSYEGYATIVALLTGAYISSLILISKWKGKKIYASICSGIGLLLILLLTNVMVCRTGYAGVGESGLLILCGSALPIFSGKRKNRGGRFGKVRF